MRDVSHGEFCSGSRRRSLSGSSSTSGPGALVAHVRPSSREQGRCGLCRRRCPGYDTGPVRRRWRSLHLGTTKAMLEADTPRVKCRTHGVVVAHVSPPRAGGDERFRLVPTRARWTVTDSPWARVEYTPCFRRRTRRTRPPCAS